MRGAGTKLWAIVAAGVFALAGCSGDGRLRDMTPDGTEPEEFAIVPNKPLAAPPDMAALPAPTPGGANRADLTPLQDSVAALGGQPAALVPAGAPPAADAALVQQASRFGVPQDLRATLAAEDAAFRRSKARFTGIRLFVTDRYAQAYRAQTLDPRAALAAWRRAGAVTPSAPPAN